MFPTPPSLEQQNSAFSPINQPCLEYLNHGSVAGVTQIEQTSLGDISEVEVDDTMGSPKPDTVEVLYHFVFSVIIGTVNSRLSHC